jgi:hypothetical protein
LAKNFRRYRPPHVIHNYEIIHLHHSPIIRREQTLFNETSSTETSELLTEISEVINSEIVISEVTNSEISNEVILSRKRRISGLETVFLFEFCKDGTTGDILNNLVFENGKILVVTSDDNFYVADFPVFELISDELKEKYKNLEVRVLKSISDFVLKFVT